MAVNFELRLVRKGREKKEAMQKEVGKTTTTKYLVHLITLLKFWCA